MVRVLQERYGLTGPDAHTTKANDVRAHEAAQVGFAW